MFLIDRLFKVLVVNYLKGTVTLIPNLLSLVYVKNIGAAFSLMEGKTTLLAILSLLAFLVIYKELIILELDISFDIQKYLVFL